MISKTDRRAERIRRHKRVRTKVSGTTECQRLAVFKSNKNLVAQIIDDVKGETLVYVSTLDEAIKTNYSQTNEKLRTTLLSIIKI